jgi:GT2 family glycosyltransferase
MSRALAGIVVVHFGEPEPTLRCVTAVAEDPSEIERRVVVVDNSANLDPDLFDPSVMVLPRPDNPGYGAGVNAGLALIDADRACSLYVALNNDSLIRPGFLDRAARAIEVGVGAAGGPIRASIDRPAVWYAGGGVNFVTGTVWQRRSQAASKRRRDVGFIPATALAFSPRAWREIGGFDPRFFLYNEDLDLCLRLRRAGWRLVFEPGMIAEHRLGGSTGSDAFSPLYLENITGSRIRPFKSLPYRLYLAAIHTVYNLLRIVGLGLRRGLGGGSHISAVARGHARALRTVFR